MNILIDFTQNPIQKVGVGVYALNLVSKIYEIDKKNSYYILVQDDDDSLNSINNNNFKILWVKSSIFRKFIFRLFLEQFYIPFLTLKYKIHIFHSLHYSFPLIILFGKRVVTIHDMTFFKFPEKHLLVKRLYFSFFIRLSAVLVDKIISVSKSTRDDFMHLFKVDRSKMHVIYHGVNEKFSPNLDKTRVDILKKKFNINSEYLLFIGTIEPRKNIKKLILAFLKFSQENRNCQLVIAGKKGWHFNDIFRYVNDFALNSKVIFTGFIEEEEKPLLIAGAKIFVYPSLYEGFGIPVLESLACGIPTITSNVSSLPEVAGEAALLIDPTNKDNLYLSIKKLLEDNKLYDRLKQKSIEQARKFSWEKAALETIHVYESLKCR